MIVVIQCAKSKHSDAGRLLTPDGQRVLFVADPMEAPVHKGRAYAKPDDSCVEGVSWRAALLSYNLDSISNPLGLCQAYRLYKNPIYSRLVERLGLQNVYILSAGWGLIAASFLTPAYDISYNAESYKRRRRSDLYQDFAMLPKGTAEAVVFFGGKAYVHLFSSLAGMVKSRRVVFYNAVDPPEAPGCELRRFHTNRKTNWHYECAEKFLDGTLF